MTKPYDFHLNILDEDDKEFLKSQPNLSNFLRTLITDFRTGKLSYSEKNIDAETKVMRLRKLTAEVRIKEFEANQIEKYGKVFGKSPSYQGHKAIKEGALEETSQVTKLYRELSEEELNKFAELISLENTADGYKMVCLLCRLESSFSERMEAILEANRHLVAVHGKKFLK